MSEEIVEPGLELLERQSRFFSEHLRRVFVVIYRIVGNVAMPRTSPGSLHQALQRQEQLKDEQKAPMAVADRYKYAALISCAGTAASVL